MNKANKFDDKESLELPANHVLAIVKNANEAGAIAETLNQAGFAPDDIGILTGTEGAKKLDAATGKKGFLAKLLTSGIDMGDRDTDYVAQYRSALMEGKTVLGVVAKNDEARSQVRQTLKAGGAHFITFFGQFVTEVWEA
jgi:hypothetical protein